MGASVYSSGGAMKLGKLLGILTAGSIGLLGVLDWTGNSVPSSLVYLAGGITGISCLYVILKQGLLTYVTKRTLEAVLTIFVICTATFLILRYIPGGPFDSERAMPAEVKANIEAKYKLNEPILVQYMDYVGGVLHGDLGESYKYIGRPISDIIKETFPVSFQLGIYAIFISFLIGIPLGVYAASNHNTFKDTAAMGLAISGIALPSFFVAPIAILIFSFWFGWLPPALWEGPEYYLMPVIILGLRPAAIIARLTRSSVLDVIKSDYVRTAYAKGLDQKIVLYKHVLRNSLIPVITISGPFLNIICVIKFLVL
jgi:oligopeptide transport system permease protein